MKHASKIGLLLAASSAMAVHATFADEPSKSQAADAETADANNIARTDTQGNATGTKVQSDALDRGDLNAKTINSVAETNGTVGTDVNDSGVKQPGSPVDSDTSAQTTFEGAGERVAHPATEAKTEAVAADGDKVDPNAEKPSEAGDESGGGLAKRETDEEFESGNRKTETDEEKKAREDAEAASAAANVRSGNDVVPAEYRERYAAGNGTCGDFIATEVSTMVKEGKDASMLSLKKENGIEADRWNGLNPGMQRMNLANVLRAAFLKGDTIKLGGKEYSLAASLAEFEGVGDERDPLDLSTDSNKELDKFLKMMDVQVNDKTRSAVRKALLPKPPVKTAEDRAAEKKAKEDERAKAAADKKADREKAAAEKKAKREEVAAEKKADREKVAAEKKAAAEQKKADDAAEKAKAKEARDAEDKAKSEAEAQKGGTGGAQADPKQVSNAAANKAKGENKKAGATK